MYRKLINVLKMAVIEVNSLDDHSSAFGRNPRGRFEKLIGSIVTKNFQKSRFKLKIFMQHLTLFGTRIPATEMRFFPRLVTH